MSVCVRFGGFNGGLVAGACLRCRRSAYAVGAALHVDELQQLRRLGACSAMSAPRTAPLCRRRRAMPAKARGRRGQRTWSSAHVEDAVVRLHVHEERRDHAHRLLPRQVPRLGLRHQVLVELLERRRPAFATMTVRFACISGTATSAHGKYYRFSAFLLIDMYHARLSGYHGNGLGGCVRWSSSTDSMSVICSSEKR
eukprot:1033376-Rhodomonas_salina.2